MQAGATGDTINLAVMELAADGVTQTPKVLTGATLVEIAVRHETGQPTLRFPGVITTQTWTDGNLYANVITVSGATLVLFPNSGNWDVEGLITWPNTAFSKTARVVQWVEPSIV